MLGAIGIAAGTFVAWMVGRSLQALLAGLSPADPTTLVIAMALALALTLVGSMIPAIRASRTNPKDALSET
jgi:ABC-type antimicrobial peptide transport system permease subunit